MKKLLITAVIVLSGTIAMAKPQTIVTYTIDAEKNAYFHNNLGVECLSEKDYVCAIQEFKIAISLNPNTQATAIYYNNLGKTYMTVGAPSLSIDCFERALKQYSLNFEYYENLVKCYKQLGMAEEKISYYQKLIKDNPLNQILVGLLQYHTGQLKKAVITLDEFSSSEPDLLITPAVKNKTKEIIKELNSKK